MLILGIETTCDETGIAIVKDGTTIIKNVVVSSAELHKKFGGIVPEIAAREQILSIIPAIYETISDDAQISNIDAVAVANGPGLIGSLLIGVETAKTLALIWQKKVIAVNHLVGHVYANWLVPESKVKSQKSKSPQFPLVALIASGAHTDLVLMTKHNQFQWLGGSLDDAAGESFDKVARALGLGYPGGPEIEKIASDFQIRNPTRSAIAQGRPEQRRGAKHEIRLSTRNSLKASNFQFPRPLMYQENFDFSFSGLKTAVVNKVKSFGCNITDKEKAAIAFEFQNAVIEVLVTKTIRAAKKFKVKSIVIGGGVAANSSLRSQLIVNGSRIKVLVFFPKKGLSIDNGAMIAAAAFFTKNYVDPLKLFANPSLHF
ncbi:hypothetical protein A3I53_03135 [Candidatus Curtissbacteria bacterium RIFCSPLOWO2_02_FULL_40_13b]|uniref:tRNA N6-adenosine threonylcarbamoyltransferase n=2 Tax=Candidatus Curtissiibacteriota TaxID=1752717 RepID=A0A1F5HVM1_9BACT|nr:MAG: hypothetical protein A2693_01690 [Candidatus Curtissbacteria bacterium RIFCSPHIGHO2_01_FULL_40_12]OGE08222.1 MAG: hypothetical protein A3I53_03135 [Candidatus Curtissbacteria bacterium RIFCSPLOWO2_02_FULL_40_13b]